MVARKRFCAAHKASEYSELALERFGGHPVRPVVVAAMQAVRREGFVFPSHVGKEGGQANDQLIGTLDQRMFERQRKKALGYFATEA